VIRGNYNVRMIGYCVIIIILAYCGWWTAEPVMPKQRPEMFEWTLLRTGRTGQGGWRPYGWRQPAQRLKRFLW